MIRESWLFFCYFFFGCHRENGAGWVRNSNDFFTLRLSPGFAGAGAINRSPWNLGDHQPVFGSQELVLSNIVGIWNQLLMFEMLWGYGTSFSVLMFAVAWDAGRIKFLMQSVSWVEMATMVVACGIHPVPICEKQLPTNERIISRWWTFPSITSGSELLGKACCSEPLPHALTYISLQSYMAQVSRTASHWCHECPARWLWLVPSLSFLVHL